MSQVCLSGSLQEILAELFRPQPEVPAAQARGPAYLAVAAGLLLALPSLGLSLFWVRSGMRRLHRVALPHRRRYVLDDVQVSAEKLKVVQSFLTMVRPDLDEHKPVQLELDFGSPQTELFRRQLVEKGPLRKARYAQPWLKLKVALCDGRRLEVSVCRIVREKLKRKTRSHKLRLVMVDCIRLALHPLPELAAPATAPDGLRCKGLTPQGELMLQTAQAYYREVKGCRIEDSLDRLLTGERLLTACIVLFHSAQLADDG